MTRDGNTNKPKLKNERRNRRRRKHKNKSGINLETETEAGAQTEIETQNRINERRTERGRGRKIQNERTLGIATETEQNPETRTETGNETSTKGSYQAHRNINRNGCAGRHVFGKEREPQRNNGTRNGNGTGIGIGNLQQKHQRKKRNPKRVSIGTGTTEIGRHGIFTLKMKGRRSVLIVPIIRWFSHKFGEENNSGFARGQQAEPTRATRQ